MLHVMLVLNYSTYYKHKNAQISLTDRKKYPIPGSLHSSQASIQESLWPVTDKVLAIF